jgi:hypothetical protein
MRSPSIEAVIALEEIMRVTPCSTDPRDFHVFRPASPSLMRHLAYALGVGTFAFLAGSSVLLAQTSDSTTSAVQASAAPASSDDSIVIPDGTEFNAVNEQLVTSKTAAIGDPVNFTVDEDVIVNGTVVIAKGALVKGSVTYAEHNGHFGKPGKLNIQLVSTTAIDGQSVKLRASRGNEGKDKTNSTVALTVLLGPVGLLKHGANAEMKKGAKMIVYTDAPFTLHRHA